MLSKSDHYVTGIGNFQIGGFRCIFFDFQIFAALSLLWLAYAREFEYAMSNSPEK